MKEQDEFSKKFGETLRTFRKGKNISQEHLAFEAGLDRTYISLLERGLRQPSIKSLFAIAKALQVSPHEIIASLEEVI